jgi:DNA topoisomerase I
MVRMRRADCSGAGISRRRRGRGFEFVDHSGNPVREAEVLARIRELAIPPAWKDVWICPYPNGHLQAVGTDAAGRRQYLYHQQWRQRRDQEKFDHMMDFARRLPVLREKLSADLRRRQLDYRRVLACSVRLLDLGFFRIGTEGYAEQNQTYGLATIQKRHVRLTDGVITFDYVAKSGKRQIRSVADSEVITVVSSLKRRRGGGPELLAYKASNRWVDVKSNDINDYIRETAKGDFTAKDFRTWNATVLAAVALAVSGEAAHSKTARKRAMARAVQEVAHYLGNTPAVCRASYIDPRVFDRYLSKWTIRPALDAIGEDVEFGQPSTQGPVEGAVLDLLENNKSSPALERIPKAS